MATEDLEGRVVTAASCAEPQLMEQYSAFGKKCREIISELIASGAYPNLRSNKLRHIPVESSWKARVNILGRPCMQHAGTRNLNVGKSEIVFVVQAPLINPSDYKEGFSLYGRRGWLRIVAGNDLVNKAIEDRTFSDITAIMMGEAKTRLTELSACLSHADYGGFVKAVVRIADSAVNKLMTEYHSNQPS